MGLIGGIIVLLLLLTGLFANFIAPYDPNALIPGARLAAPSSTYLLGADNLGRDLLSRIIFGARISLIVGLAGAGLEVSIGFLIGGISGFYGGKIDLAVQRVVEVFMCFPPLILYLSVMAIVGAGLVPLVLVLGITSGIMGSRTTRSAVIGVKNNVYVEASAATGAKDARILLKHILPNIMPVLIIQFTLSVGRMILAESTLSFLGFGIPPPTPSWGGMLSGAGRRYMLQAPWLALWPGLALTLVVYGANMLGDALRDLWDPRLRGGLGRYGREKAVKQPKTATS